MIAVERFERIGQEVSEVVERRPASLVVARIVRPKFVRKGEVVPCDTDAPEVSPVMIAETPERPIERGLDRLRDASPLAAEALPRDVIELLGAEAESGTWGAVILARSASQVASDSRT